MYDRYERKGRDDGQRVRKIYRHQHRPAQPRPRGHAGQTYPIKGGQRPWTQWEGFVVEVPFLRALYLPRLPNATSVQQETDHNYGPFKGIVHDNLKKMSLSFYAAGLTIPLNMTTFGLIVYGGTIAVGPSTTITCRNALQESFDVESNLNSWRAVGAVPHTRKCLTNSKVRHDGTDKRDPNFDAYQDIQSQNDYSTAQLNLMGYRGDVLRAVF